MALRERIGGWLRRLRQTAHLMVGLPDYDQYVAHRRQHHPHEPLLTRDQFIKEMQQRRYAGKNSNRCC